MPKGEEAVREEWCVCCFHMKKGYEVCPYCGYREGVGAEKECYLVPGTILRNRYVLGGVLGQGGFGITYRAFDTALGTVTAIKEFFPAGLANRAAGSSSVESFTGDKKEEYQRRLAEFRDSAARMAVFSEEPDMVQVHNYFEANHTAYLEMEYVEGMTLRRVLEDRGKIKETEAVSVFCDLCDALQKIHEKGMVHRDISPDNLMITDSGRLKLLDFGMGSQTESEALQGMAGVKAGYSPPEQYAENRAAAQTEDIYAAGAVLYEMLTGMRFPEAIWRLATVNAQDALEKPEEITENVWKVIGKATEYRPEARYFTAQAMKAELLMTEPEEKPEHFSETEKSGGWEKRCMGCMELLESTDKVCPHCGYKRDTKAEAEFCLKPGTVLHGKYVIGRVLGIGGFGITYIGWDQNLRRKIAVKEYFPSEFCTREKAQKKISVYPGETKRFYYKELENFMEEAKRLAKCIQIRQIVKIFDCFLENETGYLVMEYLTGKSVKDMVKEQGKLSVDTAFFVADEILDALSQVHGEGLIHRDIAPDNILLTGEGKVKLLDFGSARFSVQTHSCSISVVLKPGYAPEEQYRSQGEQGPWTDVYSMAATLYRMLTGKRPQPAVERLMEDKLMKPSELGVKLDKEKEKALMHALGIRREERYQTAKEFRQALQTEETKKSFGKKLVGLWKRRKGKHGKTADSIA